MKSVFFITLFLLTLANFSSLLSQERIRFATKGDTTVVPRKDFNNFSLKIPASTDVSEIAGTVIVKFANESNFASMLSATYLPKKANSDALDLLEQTIELNGKSTKWALDKIYKFSNEELQFGNSGTGYMINGYVPDKQPMKIFNIMGVFESADKKQMVIYACSISVNPDHKYYNDFNEIKKYMYDFKVIMTTTEFKK
jgi:hypothetical protein